MSGNTQAHEGLFPVSYIITTGAPGAQNLQLNLLVNSSGETVTGTAHVTQATNPPLDLHSDVRGQFTYLTIMPPSEGRILITAQGSAGAPHSSAAVNFKIHLVLEHDWKKGVANYSYFNGQQWVDVENAPAKLNEKLQSRRHPEIPMGPGPVIPSGGHVIPLYGVPIQSAIASGDLTHMKTLASLAQQQLDSKPQLEAALAELKAEIAKLGG